MSKNINYDNIKAFTVFSKEIEIPDPISKQEIDKVLNTGVPSETHNDSKGGGGFSGFRIGNRVAAVPSLSASKTSFVASAPAPASASIVLPSSKIDNTTHIGRYHPHPSVVDRGIRPADRVFKFAKKAKKEYSESYFAQYNYMHRPHVFEVLIDNETLQPVAIPTAPPTGGPTSYSSSFKPSFRKSAPVAPATLSSFKLGK